MYCSLSMTTSLTVHQTNLPDAHTFLFRFSTKAEYVQYSIFPRGQQILFTVLWTFYSSDLSDSPIRHITD